MHKHIRKNMDWNTHIHSQAKNCISLEVSMHKYGIGERNERARGNESARLRGRRSAQAGTETRRGRERERGEGEGRKREKEEERERRSGRRGGGKGGGNEQGKEGAERPFPRATLQRNMRRGRAAALEPWPARSEASA